MALREDIASNTSAFKFLKVTRISGLRIVLIMSMVVVNDIRTMMCQIVGNKQARAHSTILA